MHKRDPLRGLNPDQSGPLEKIQNGDPRSSAHRDQRSGAREAGGPGHSLQQGNTVIPLNTVPTQRPTAGIAPGRDTQFDFPEGVEGTPLPVAALDRAGEASYAPDVSLSSVTGGAGGTSRTRLEETDDGLKATREARAEGDAANIASVTGQ